MIKDLPILILVMTNISVLALSGSTVLTSPNPLYAAIGTWIVCIAAPAELTFGTIGALLNLIVLSK